MNQLSSESRMLCDKSKKYPCFLQAQLSNPETCFCPRVTALKKVATGISSHIILFLFESGMTYKEHFWGSNIMLSKHYLKISQLQQARRMGWEHMLRGLCCDLLNSLGLELGDMGGNIYTQEDQHTHCHI